MDTDGQGDGPAGRRLDHAHQGGLLHGADATSDHGGNHMNARHESRTQDLVTPEPLMYVCMYVCNGMYVVMLMCVCMYVCMHLCE